MEKLNEKNYKKIYKRIAKRDKDIVMRIFFPGEVLQTIGDRWGLTRERVRQIISSYLSGMDYVSARKTLEKESSMFKCFVCGDSLTVEKARKVNSYYCDKCTKLVGKYDLKDPAECDYCGDIFFPYRNRKYTKRLRQNGHQFCNRDCYMKFNSKTGYLVALKKLRKKERGLIDNA